MHRPIFASLLLTAVLPAWVHAFYTFPGGELYVQAELTGTYDSNVYLQGDALGDPPDDFIFTLAPAIYAVRDAGAIRAEFEGGVEIGRFVDLKSEDYEDPFAIARLFFDRDDYPFNADAQFSWRKITYPEPAVQDRLEADRKRAEFDSRYKVDRKFFLTFGGDYEVTDYSYTDARNDTGIADRTIYEVKMGAGYSYSDKLDFGINYRYGRTDLKEVTNGLQASDHSFYLSAEGEILSKITGYVMVGMQYREVDDNVMDSIWNPYASIRLNWAVDDATDVVLSGLSEFSASPNNESITYREVAAEVRRKIDAKILAFLGVYMASIEYETALTTRDDEEWGTFGGLEYTFTRLASARLEARYLDRDSNAGNSGNPGNGGYDRLLTTLSFSFRY